MPGRRKDTTTGTSTALASMGGAARAAKLSAGERSAIAKKAADDRWALARNLPKETHAGVLKLGAGIPCSVLSNGQRVFSVNGLLRAFGTGAKSRATLDGGTPVPEFLAAINVQPFISLELRSRLENTTQFRPLRAGGLALGYDADILNLICDALLDARAAGVLRPNQLRIAGAAELLTRAFSKVGLIALIDEATGYQFDRAHDELQRLVALYVVEDMRPWVRMFPDAFFRRVYKLYGWPYKPGVTQGPRYVGKFINNYIYDGLPEAVLERLRERNPVVNDKGQRRHKHFQFLTEDVGDPAVDRRLASVMTLIDVSQNKDHFKQMYRVAFPKMGEQLLIGSTVQPPLLGAAVYEDDDSSADIATAEAEVEPVGGVEVVTIATRTSERILQALRERGGTETFQALGIAAYGTDPVGKTADAKNAANKLRRILERMSEEGLVRSPEKGVWSLT